MPVNEKDRMHHVSSVITAVRTPLGLCTLIILVIEAILGVVLAQLPDMETLMGYIIIGVMAVAFLIITAVVAYRVYLDAGDAASQNEQLKLDMELEGVLGQDLFRISRFMDISIVEALAHISLEDPKEMKRLKDLSDEETQALQKTNVLVHDAKNQKERNKAISAVLSDRNIEILNKATFKRYSAQALHIFGKASEAKPKIWEELTSNVVRSQLDNTWLDELCFAIKSVAVGDPITAINATFISADETHSVYRPVLYAVEKTPHEATDVFFILFVKDIRALDAERDKHKIEAPERSYSQLVFSIRVGYRFRWEVTEQYRTIESVGEISALGEAIARVMQEIDILHLDLEDLGRVSFEGDQAERVNELYLKFMAVLQELDIAIKDEDVEKIRGLLNNFVPVSQEYLQLATKRFAEMNSNPGFMK